MRILFIYLFIILSCGTNNKNILIEKKDSLKMELANNQRILAKDTIVKIGKTPIWIKIPEAEIKADILILPGWNFAKEKICEESDFCEKALKKGYRLILPEMMKSVYASNYFPETRSDYKSFLTLTWVIDTMIPNLQKEFGLFMGKNNYLHGISTGSRGAALVHLNSGTLFNKVILLSGDYNNAEIPNDNLMKNIYGPYVQFKERWIENDNPWEQSTIQWTADLYIAHGTNDDVVPVEQSIRFANKIEKDHPNCRIIKNFPASEHDFVFWGGETEKILEFLEK